MKPRFDVVGVGNCAADFLAVFDPYPGLDERAQAKQLLQQGGGETATALVALSRLGARVSYVGKVGDDQFGDFIRKGLREEKVDISRIIIEKGKTSIFAFCAVDARTGKRTIFWYKNITPIKRTELNRSFITSCSLVHLDHRNLKAGIIVSGWAKKAGIPVTLDIDRFPPEMEKMVRNTSVILGSQTLSEEISSRPETAAGELLKSGPSAVVLTFGEKGSLVKTADEQFRQPAFQVNVVDTTGAGDTFRGAFAYGVLKRWPLRETARFASAVAALKCTKLGGRTGIPTLQETLKFLAGQPE